MRSNFCENIHGSSQSSMKNWQFGGTYEGWMGERSVPTTEAPGNSCATSMAQIPVPVAMSRTLWRWPGRMGEAKRAVSMVMRKRWCWRSIIVSVGWRR